MLVQAKYQEEMPVTETSISYNNDIYLLHLGCYPVAVVILHV